MGNRLRGRKPGKRRRAGFFSRKKLYWAVVLTIVFVTIASRPSWLLGRAEDEQRSKPGQLDLQQEISLEKRRPRITPSASPSVTATPKAAIKKSPAKERDVYPLHTVITTVFWVGEGASEENSGISNWPSAWDSNTVETFGGVDDPGSPPAKPRHNPFYFALPLEEFSGSGRFTGCYWPDPGLPSGKSLYKSRWIKVAFAGKEAYLQWLDVGPSNTDRPGAVHDPSYVCGTSQPKYGQAGLDISPAAARYLGLDGRATTSWKFVDAKNVPQGPWKEFPPITNQSDW